MKNQKHDSERRSDPRFDVRLPLRIGIDNSQIATNTKNLSSSGVYCQVDRFVPVMTKISLKMMIPLIEDGKKVEKNVEAKAVVVRIRPEAADEITNFYQVGLFFTEIADQDREFIKKYLQHAFFAGSN
jgi:hypothetical protein